MIDHEVTGGGGVRLHLVETGRPLGQPILFIHGFSQSRFAWSRQLRSDLTDDFRLIAMDMRGHGNSDKPRDAYGDARLWADDVNAVIDSLGLDHPVLVGWSYGPLVILDYIRHYGEDRIGGVNFIGGVSKLGSDEALSVLTPEFLGLVPGFFSTDAEESVNSLEALLRLCVADNISDEELYLMLGCSVSAPPYVRQGLLSRSIDNDDLLPQIRGPVLITHGAADAVVKTAAADQFAAVVPHAEIHFVEDAPHAVFWSDTSAYNHRLRQFASGIGQLATSA